MTLRTLDLFAGSGGFTIACEMAGGFETAAFCEIEPYAQKVLAKHWPNVPIHSDVTKLKADDVYGTVDLITGGFPCQDLSSAGKGAGIGDGTRSGLFREMLRLAEEFSTKQGYLPYILFENVQRLLSGPTEDRGQWFGEFLWQLAESGYDAEWFCVTAASFGAPHERERICVVAHPNCLYGKCRSGSGPELWNEESSKRTDNNLSRSIARFKAYSLPNTSPIERGSISRRIYAQHADIDRATSWWKNWGEGEPEVRGVDDGLRNGSHRLALMGNAIVPQVFAPVMQAIKDAINE